MLLLFGARRRLVRAAMRSKQRAQVPLRDPLREAQVLRRARAIGAQHAVPAAASTALLQVLIEDAWRLQQIGAGAWPSLVHEAIPMNDTTSTQLPPDHASLLRLLPRQETLHRFLALNERIEALHREVARAHLSLFTVPFQPIMVVDALQRRVALYSRPPRDRFTDAAFSLVIPHGAEAT